MSGAFGSGPTLPALRNHVSRVFGWQAEKEMIWPHAWRVVTPMADEHAGGHRPEVDFPGDTVRQLDAPVSLGNHERAVPGRHAASGPQPAAIRLADLLPEAFQHGTCASAVIALRGAVLTRRGNVGVERRAALAAGARGPSRRRETCARAMAGHHPRRRWVGLTARGAGTLNGHRANSSVSGSGQLTLRRGHFASQFYQIRGAQ